MDSGSRDNACGYGKYRSLLEACLQHLEDSFKVILVNARHVKNVPGRKTDVQDSEWLCELLRNGLVRGSFIPPKPARELRDLTRYKSKKNKFSRSPQKSSGWRRSLRTQASNSLLLP